jgi:2-dehydro-3-deoxygluconokinase
VTTPTNPVTPQIVALGEVMIRDTPRDLQRLESTREVFVSPSGSEYTVALLARRLGVPSAYVTRLPDNPYGWMIRDIARAHDVDVSGFVWAPAWEPIGRYLYELGREPRPSYGWYQRAGSAAARLGPGEVAWKELLSSARILHTSGITFGLASHAGLANNPLLAAFEEAVSARPEGCAVGLDFNYRSTLWSKEECRGVLEGVLVDHTDILMTSPYDMAQHFAIGFATKAPEDVLEQGLTAPEDDELHDFCLRVLERFDLDTVAVTLRQPRSFTEHLWESCAMRADGSFARSKTPRPIRVLDRLGGGDAWTAGFYASLLQGDGGEGALESAIAFADASTRLAQTLMFDLAVLRAEDVRALLDADEAGYAQGTIR